MGDLSLILLFFSFTLFRIILGDFDFDGNSKKFDWIENSEILF